MGKPRPEHPQTPFFNSDGEFCDVDEGLLDLLNILRDLGVRTQYSCQGSEKLSAYFSAETKSIRPLITKILQVYNRNELSHESSLMVDSFVKGYRTREFMIVRYGKSLESLRVNLHRGRKSSVRYSYERKWIWRTESFETRTVVRWPSDKTPRFLALLDEVSQLYSQD